MPYDRNDPDSTDALDAPDPSLADAFAALPRELPLVDGEEERTVAALRQAGLLRGGTVGAEEPSPGEVPVPAETRVISLLPRLDARAWRAVTRVTVGLAASLALFVAGTYWGEARA